MAVNPRCPECKKFGKNYKGLISLMMFGEKKELFYMCCQHCGNKYVLPVINLTQRNNAAKKM